MKLIDQKVQLLFLIIFQTFETESC